jgi:ubiquinone/menaquinone biosynthesis C-methylase UbiE
MLEPFAFADNSVDFVYVGQAIEHMNYIHQVPKFLKEMHRVLKPGGIIRMTTPDLTKLLLAYNSNEMMKFADDQPDFYKDLDPSAQLSLLMFGASGQDCTQERYEGHFFCYTEKAMEDLLRKIGFKEIEFRSYGQKSKNREIENELRDEGMSHSFVVEAIK